MRLAGHRVLIADPGPENREILKTLLEACGAETSMAETAAGALRRITDWQPHVMTVEIELLDDLDGGEPLFGGLTLMRRVRSLATQDGGRTPILALTAYAKTEDRMKCLLAGAHRYMAKPADPDEIVGAVAALAAGGPTPPPKLKDAARRRRRTAARTERLDLFISHASEDKGDVARPLYDLLIADGFSVWFDEAELCLGDSLRRRIDDGLKRCRFGIVILSPSFFAKEWTQRELDGLVARETGSGRKVILPVWHNVEHDDVLRYSATLADKLAAKTTDGLPAVTAAIKSAWSASTD